MSDVLTDERIADLKAQLAEAGYQGPVKKTKVGFQTFAYRAVTGGEYDRIMEHLSRDPNATQQDLSNWLVVTGVVFPQLTVDRLGELGLGVVHSLREKIELVSGVLAEPFAHFLGDEDLAVFEPWDELEDEAKAEVAEPFVKDTNVGVRATMIMGFAFIYRNLKGGEYRDLVGGEGDPRPKLLAKAVLWPKDVDWSTVPAFIPEAMEHKILALSGVDANPGIEDDEEL
jgi:hypothetical protein